MKTFLLIAHQHYYPQSGTDDWIDTFSTREEAQSEVVVEKTYEYFSRGPNKGKPKPGSEREITTIRGCQYDWYEIVDLKVWMNR